MAVPTITNVSPATGPAGGHNIVTLTGTNFKTPTVSYSIPITEDIPTVSVTVNGVSALAVSVLSSTEIDIIVPRYRGSVHTSSQGFLTAYPAVDIVVSNLDSDGDVISGEVATASSAYTYARWNLGPPDNDPPILQVLRRLMQDLMLDITSNVGRGIHVDFTETGTDTQRIIANPPCIGVGVSTPKDKEWAYWDNGKQLIEDGDGNLWEYDGAWTRMLVCDLLIVGEGEREAAHIVDRVEEFVHLHPHFTVDADQDLFPGEEDEHVLEVSSYPVGGNDPNNADIKAYAMQVRVRGIQMLPTYPERQIFTAATLIWAEMKMADGVSEGTAREITLQE